MISGVALGAALLASAPAIVLSFALPIGLGDRRAAHGARRRRALAGRHVLAGAADRAPDERHRVGARGHDARAVDGACRCSSACGASSAARSADRVVDSPRHGARCPPVPRHRPGRLRVAAARGGDADRLRAQGVLRPRPVRQPGLGHAARLQRPDADRRAGDRPRRPAPERGPAGRAAAHRVGGRRPGGRSRLQQPLPSRRARRPPCDLRTRREHRGADGGRHRHRRRRGGASGAARARARPARQRTDHDRRTRHAPRRAPCGRPSSATCAPSAGSSRHGGRAAAAASLVRPVAIEGKLLGAWRIATTNPRPHGCTAVRAVALVVIGVLVIAQPLTAVQVAVTLAGIYIAYKGIEAILTLIYRAAEKARDEEARPKKRSGALRRARRLAVPAIAVLLVAGVVAAFLGGGGASAPAAPISACNGHAALCDRRFDQVVLPATHNAMSAPAEGVVLRRAGSVDRRSARGRHPRPAARHPLRRQPRATAACGPTSPTRSPSG